MEKRQSLTLWLEVIWWIVTALVVAAVLYPIRKAMHHWPYQGWNIIFVVTLLTMARYIFLLPHTFLARRQVAKIVIILVMFPLTFTLVSGLNAFLSFIEEQTWEPLTGHLPSADRKAMEEYIWGEMVFFGTGSVVAAPILVIRLFLSIWRVHNRNTV